MTFSHPNDDLLDPTEGFFADEPDTGADLFGGDDHEPLPQLSIAANDTPAPDITLSTPREAKAQADGYVVIARKYRPQTFDQLVGQDTVQQALRGAIASGQISHSYLFSGPRGTGKTSTARILAKAVNCQNGGPRPDPCGTCSSCKSITVGSSLDVLEIDAASNTGVDNIRDLKSGVALAPFSRYKVYIVDEVHMLSNQAFNALLKTLEEPPANVIFVLATTEIHKVPETIISRCQSFQFKRFSLNELNSQLGAIFDKEAEQRGITVDATERDGILDLIARSADGGMRDAQVTLDQVLVLARGSLDLHSVRRFLGMPESESLDTFITQLRKRDSEGLLLRVEELVANGQDLELFVKNLADHTRNLLLLKCCSQGNTMINASEDRVSQMREVVADIPASFLVALGDMLLKLLEELKISSQPRFALELAIIRLSMVDPSGALDEVIDRLKRLEQHGGGRHTANESSSGRQAQEVVVAAPHPAPPAASAPKRVMSQRSDNPPNAVRLQAAEIDQIESTTIVGEAGKPRPQATPEEILRSLQELTVHSNQFLHGTLCDSAAITSVDGGAIVLGIDDGDRFGYDHLTRPQSQAILRDLLREITGRDVGLRIEKMPSRNKVDSVSTVPQPAARRPENFPSTQTVAPAPRMLMPEKAVMDDDEYRPPVIYLSPEIRAKAVRDMKADEVSELLQQNGQWRDLVEKAKAAFRLDENSFKFQISTI